MAPAVPPGAAPAQRTARQRRPTGAPPPLPHPFRVTTTAWLLLAVAIVTCAFLFSQHTAWLRLDDRANTWLLRRLADARTPWLTDLARGIKTAGASWGVTAVGLSVVALTMIFRRWRHLLVFVGSLFFLEIVGQWIYYGLSRPRPYGVSIIDSWGGYSAPSPPVVVLTIFLMGAVYCLAVPGRPRAYAKTAVAVVLTVFCLARLYLAVDHLDDVLLAVALGVAIPVTAFRYFTPNEVFPVVYRRGRTAHVDVGGRRGEAIRLATRDQLGLTVLEIKPVGLESSAGSTPLRLRVEGGPGRVPVRQAVHQGPRSRRPLVQAVADHPVRLPGRRVSRSRPCGAWSPTRTMPCACCRTSGSARPGPTASWRSRPSASTCWSPSSSPARSRSARPTSTTTVIDQGLLLIRMLWDAGIAHRDIKPGNLMVRSGELLLIDVAFVQVRPSPWRQAVDLGNMMLVLAVRTDPERVYRRALSYFTPAELSEAFAATRGVASPTQLRAFMKRDPRDLLGTFRALAPPREPIVLQRWSFRRVGLAVAILGSTVIAVTGRRPCLLPRREHRGARRRCAAPATR